MTAFATEEAKVAVHSLLFLLGQLPSLEERLGLLFPEELTGGHPELLKNPELLLLEEPELPLLQLELFF